MLRKFITIFVRCLLFAAAGVLLCTICIPNCAAAPVDLYRAITVPFNAQKNDDDFRPHQLVTVNIQANKLSLPVSATFVFDTGSTHCAISARLAAKLGLPLHPLKDRLGNPLKLDGKTAIGINVEQMDIGGFQVKDVPINILPDEQLTQGLGQPVDGIVGADIWHSLVVQLDFTKNELTFIASNNPATYSELASTAVNLTRQDIGQLGFSKALVVPLLHDLYTYSALFEMKNGTQTETQSLLIDTGTPDTAISQPVADLLGLEPAVKASYAAIKNFNVNVSWLSSLHCGDLTGTDLLVASPCGYVPGFVPRLGLDVLANYDILLDFPHQKMYLKPRTDLQAVTLRQYEAASPSQRRQWAQNPLYVLYPSPALDFGTAIPYDLTSSGLPLARVRPNLTAAPLPFLMKTNFAHICILQALADKWQVEPHSVLDDAGKPYLLDGKPVSAVTFPVLHIGGTQANGPVAVFSDKDSRFQASNLPVQGIVGTNFLFGRPLLMDPLTQTWIQLTGLHAEDLPSLEMADAAAVDILDPDKDGIPAVVVQVQQGAAQFTETMILATGSSFTVLSVQAAKTLNLTPEPQKLRYGVGKDITVFNQAHLAQLSIGGVVLKDVPVAYPIGAMPEGFYPRLGMDIISRLRLLMDEPSKTLYIKIAGQ